MAGAAAALRERGLPLTVQRRRLLERFLLCTDHPAAETLYADVAPLVPGLSRATVYRTLETLVELGLAVRIGHPGWEVRYDPRIERHHHLVCDGCGAVSDHESAALDALRPPRRIAGFAVRDFSVQFRGLCVCCTRLRSKRAPHTR